MEKTLAGAREFVITQGVNQNNIIGIYCIQLMKKLTGLFCAAAMAVFLGATPVVHAQDAGRPPA